MFRPRIIPVLLLRGQGLVKSIKFKNHQYIGDPINAVRIFNDHKADELTFLDIMASREGRSISLDFVKEVGEEANMPFVVGGGIKDVKTIQEIISCGAEKVIINSYALQNPSFIEEAVNEFGSSTITVCLDIKKNFWGKQEVYGQAGTKSVKGNPAELAKQFESLGAGELVIQSIDNDGVMGGYDIDLVKRISESVEIPVIALGGAGTIDDLKKVYSDGYANGLAAGSLFVYHDKKRGVLINYPNVKEINFHGRE